MGYTHYWYVKDMQAVARALPLVANDLKRLLPELPPPGWAGWDGESHLGAHDGGVQWGCTR